MSKKLYIKTYGCQMNVYDSNRMEDVLRPLGYATSDADGNTSANTPENADLVILNTCHIREKAAEKVYSDIGRIRILKERRQAEGKEMILVVAGCVAQAEGAEIMRRAPAVDIVLGPQTYHRLPELLEKARAERARGRAPRVMDTEFPAEPKFDALPAETRSRGPAAFLTIQEGCDKFCTFCVVPYTRGAEFSRRVEEIEAEARRLVAGGAAEITLLGQNVNAYHGLDESGKTVGLGRLIRRVAAIEGLQRIRYTTSHPLDVDQELADVHADVAECMPYVHLPVQSGSDNILRAMNRRHGIDDYCRAVDMLRRARADLALSSDFIVGFPGESDTDFEATMRLVREVGFSQAYSFKYSPRPGTPAAAMENQVPEEAKAERLAELQAELNRQQLAFNEASVGRQMPVLFERAGREAGQISGRSPYMQAVHVIATAADAADSTIRGENKARGNGNPDGVAPAYTGAYTANITGVANFTGVAVAEIISAGPNSLQGRLL
ncbi:MAG: tRNA (N6-isopentenyl adenosine(37)-C2)-methylthiotransferase MiaB [Proteobacteria bacterium]|nr:tRNA (N6-isopentenyl adenosine(37)-C2)-methylthiotransferase MiaB [Pseudomonadota bacterium]